MPFPGFAKLYNLTDPIADLPYRGEFEPDYPPTTGPRRIGWASGKATPGPVVWTNTNRLIFHAKVFDLLRAARLTGWAAEPVAVTGRAGRPAAGYSELLVTGRCGPPEYRRASLTLLEFPGGWYPYLCGEFFVPDTWDGSDFFNDGRVPGIGELPTRFMTERVITTLAAAGIDGLDFTPLTETNVDVMRLRMTRPHLEPQGLEAQLEAAYRIAGVPRPSGL